MYRRLISFSRSSFGRRRWIATLAFVVASANRPALAQSTPTERVAVTVDIGAELGSKGFSQTVTFEAFSEDGSLTTQYSIPAGPQTEGNFVVRLWRGLGVGVAGSFVSGSPAAQITGSIPHPLLANQPREISGSKAALHSETAVHLQAVYWMRPSDQVDVMVSAGPSIMRIQQDFVTDVTYTQSFPYDTATYQDATLTRARETAFGANVGAELDWRVLRHVGVAAVGRYSRAKATFADTGVPGITVGGFHLGGGIRLLF